MGTARLVLATVIGALVGAAVSPGVARNRPEAPRGYWAAVDRYAANDKPGAEELLRECRDVRCRDLRSTMRIASVSSSDELYTVGNRHFAQADFELAKLLYLECLQHQPGELRCKGSLKVTYDTLGERDASRALGDAALYAPRQRWGF